MLQQVIREVQEIQTKMEQKSVKKTGAVDSDGNITYRPMHRSTFRRMVSKPTFEGVDYEWYYFEDVKEFRRTLKSFNESNKGDAASAHFTGVGYANVRLRFCSSCFDANKTLPLDLYFINRLQKSVNRTVLCLGCLGSILRKYKDMTPVSITYQQEEEYSTEVEVTSSTVIKNDFEAQQEVTSSSDNTPTTLNDDVKECDVINR